MTAAIDIGGGQSVQRHHLPKNMLREFDEATATFNQVQASVRNWVKPLTAMQAPAATSGDVVCGGPGQSGRVYAIGEVGGALLIDQRDVPLFSGIGFTAVPTQQPNNPRVGLVFLDTATGEYLRWNGTAWAAVALQ